MTETPVCRVLIDLCVYRMVAHEIGQFRRGDLGYRAARTCNRSRAEHNALDETNDITHPFTPAACDRPLISAGYDGVTHWYRCPVAGHKQEAPA